MRFFFEATEKDGVKNCLMLTIVGRLMFCKTGKTNCSVPCFESTGSYWLTFSLLKVCLMAD